jgi:hypothetical protein
MLDESNALQQEAVGILGVNLIYDTFQYYSQLDRLIQSLGDNLEWGRLEIDLIRFSGPQFEHVDNRLMALKLVEMELANAVVFSPDRKTLIHPSELFYNQNVLVMRGMFKPVTNVSLDMIASGMEIFSRIPDVDADASITVPEISIAEMRLQKAIDMPDILDRVDCLNLLNYPVIVSNYLRFFRLRDYLGRYTRKKVAFVLGIPNLIMLFDDAYYEGLDGGIMGAFASLFDRETLLFVYPMRDADNPDQVITSDSFPVPEKLKYFYRHLQANNMILPVEKYIDANLHIWPEDVLERMKNGPGAWEKDVPEVVAREIVNRCLFGYCSTA